VQGATSLRRRQTDAPRSKEVGPMTGAEAEARACATGGGLK